MSHRGTARDGRARGHTGARKKGATRAYAERLGLGATAGVVWGVGGFEAWLGLVTPPAHPHP